MDLDGDRQGLATGVAARRGDGALVHTAEAAAADERVLPEVVGHLLQLREREGHQRVPRRRRGAPPQGLHLAGVRRELALVAPVTLRRALDLGSLWLYIGGDLGNVGTPHKQTVPHTKQSLSLSKSRTPRTEKKRQRPPTFSTILSLFLSLSGTPRTEKKW
uniref:Uncharacterized protein n=1 Tax=Arundo donax TaxID=35708 RepID=A0A0A9D3R6_ARUDO